MEASPFYRDLGHAIRRAREASGLTQSELASKVGLSRTSLTNMELGRQRLLVDQLSTISHALSVTVDSLLPPRELSAQHEQQQEYDALPSVFRFIQSMRIANEST